ncbi:MAG: metal-dependent transcriptional regulator [Treponema sp.]|nr:metal-dependent transcriptional regulator [Treponema sp.]
MYESGEDYLEAILRLQEENGFVRSVDVARKLNVSRPSVSRAMGLLQEGGYIEFSLGNMIKLTPSGLSKAKDVYSRHKLLTSFLMAITGLPVDQSEENACRMEHYIDSDVVSGIRTWMKNNNVPEEVPLPSLSAEDVE